MSSMSDHHGCLAGPAVPPPLDLPSPDLSPSQSWCSGTGVIPIFLDPSLGSPSENTLPCCASDSSLLPPPSDVSVGTFGKTKCHRLQYGPTDFSNHASTRIDSWRTLGPRCRSQSLSMHRGALPSLSYLKEHSSGTGSGSSSSTTSALINASVCTGNYDEDDALYAERDLMFTASLYGDSQSNIDVPGPLGIDRPAITQHDSSLASTVCSLRGQAIRHTNKESRAPMGLRRQKSELDVPLSPTSTFLLSPSASISSRIESSHAGTRLSMSSAHLPSNRQHIHCRAASAPLSQIGVSTNGGDNEGSSMNIKVMSDQTLLDISQSSDVRRFRSVSNTSDSYQDIGMQSSVRHSNFEVNSDVNTPGKFMGALSRTFQEETNVVSNMGPSSRSVKAPFWIRSTSVELWIDQEGFRSIRPKFNLGNYWWNTGLSPNGQALDVAEFVMKRPQTWHFHYAMLDSPPVLRRLTVNGDMNDYISRQASLTLKRNGVYAVESTEDKGKFAWKFEYHVEDRRVPETAEIMDGEKRFTPLSFVCNPELLSSEHGKKVKLLHFVKKSVAPKLQSFKLGLTATNQPQAGATEIQAFIGNRLECADKDKDSYLSATRAYPSSRLEEKRRITILSKSPPISGATDEEPYCSLRESGGHRTDRGNFQMMMPDNTHSGQQASVSTYALMTTSRNTICP